MHSFAFYLANSVKIQFKISLTINYFSHENLYQSLFAPSIQKHLLSATFFFFISFSDPKYIYIPLLQVRILAADGGVKQRLLRKRDSLIKKR